MSFFLPDLSFFFPTPLAGAWTGSILIRNNNAGIWLVNGLLLRHQAAALRLLQDTAAHYMARNPALMRQVS
jgi:hypothetical protein